MTNIDRIDQILADTLNEHPNYRPGFPADVYRNIAFDFKDYIFTRKNGDREYATKLTSREFIEYFLKEAIIICSATIEYMRDQEPTNPIKYFIDETGSSHIEYVNYIIKTINDVISNKEINSILYYNTDRNELFNLVNAVMAIRFNDNWYDNNTSTDKYFRDRGSSFRARLDEIGKNSKQTETLFKKVERDVAELAPVRQIKVNPITVNKCLQEVRTGEQIKHRRNEYSLDGKMFVAQDVGLRRTNQEDSALIMTHPNLKDYKFLAVADGMGGAEKGELVSNYVLRRLSSWFASLPVNTYNQTTKNIRRNLSAFLEQVNDEVNNLYPGGGTTLVGAIVGSQDTLIFNIGDSRAYSIKDSRLLLLSRDHSLVYALYENDVKQGIRKNSTKDIDDLRKQPRLNEISRFIGIKGQLGAPYTYTINNTDYDRLLLFSDGVHDVLTCAEINALSRSTPPDEVAKLIVESALSRKPSIKTNAEEEEFRAEKAGKDNTTAAVYIRR